jgi:hypothetical protein
MKIYYAQNYMLLVIKKMDQVQDLPINVVWDLITNYISLVVHGQVKMEEDMINSMIFGDMT